MVVLDGYGGGSLTDELRRFREELLFADLEIVTNRIDKLKDLAKKTKPTNQRELEEAEMALLQRVAGVLEKGEGAAAAHLRPDEEKTIRSFQLLTAEAPVADVELSAKILGEDGKIVDAKTFRASALAKGADAPAAAAALNDAFRQTAAALVAWAAAAIQ